MKHILFCSFMICSFVFAAAQTNVGIGTAAPDVSAALDINSSSKGLLLPRVSLQSLTDQVTVPTPASGLLIYNSNAALAGGKGLYYNAGNAGGPSWARLSTGNNLVFPYYYGGNSTTSLFQVDNYNSMATSSAIKGYGGSAGIGLEGISNSGIGVYGYSHTGTGVSAASASGNALLVNGKLKLTNLGSPVAAGKVLTADANGNATWEGAVAFNVRDLTQANSPNIPPFTFVTVPFANKSYDLSNNFNMANHSFVAPANGIYTFNVQVSWNYITEDLSTWIFLMLKRNGVEITLTQTETTINSNGYYTLGVSYDTQLLPGDQVYAQIHHNAAGNMKLAYNGNNFFTGRMVVKL